MLYLLPYRTICKITSLKTGTKYSHLKTVSSFISPFLKHSYNLRNMSAKPPNILIYCDSCDDNLFQIVRYNISLCLEPDNYLIYHLLPLDIKNQTWMDNTALLCVCSDIIQNDVAEILENYVQNGGNLFVICSEFEKTICGYTCVPNPKKENSLIKINFKKNFEGLAYSCNHSYNCENSTPICCNINNRPVIHKTTVQNNIFIASEVYLDRECDNFEDKHASTFSNDYRLTILRNILHEDFGLKTSTSLHYIPNSSSGYIFNKNNIKMVSSERTLFSVCNLKQNKGYVELPIYFSDVDNVESSFNSRLFFSNLKTELFGHSVIHFNVISSTMEVSEQLLSHEGITVVADIQISGRGRGNNQWISPKGCAMFTLYFNVSLSSNLGQKLSLLQHMACLAVVHGIRKRHGYENLDINIKWPNDIYYGKQNKLGGLIVTSMIQENKARVHIGWGINVFNKNPTSCINDVIKNFNSSSNVNLSYLENEEIIASTLTELEILIKNFNKSGAAEFLSLYYLYWMHSQQKINVCSLKKEGVIIGLDDYGFLVIEMENKQKITLQPDGNRFDIMKNMIYKVL